MNAFEPRRIAVVVTRQIGDVLLTTPLIAAIHARWPAAALDIVGFGGTLGMLEGHPAVSARIELPRRPDLAFVRRHWRRHDLAFIGEASDRAHLAGFVLAPVRAGLVPQERHHAWWKRALLRHAVEVAGDRGERHVVDEKLALMAPWRDAGAGAPPVAPPPAEALPEDIAAALAHRDYAVVHAPAMWTYKQWPLDRYTALCRALVDDGLRVVLTGGPSSEDRAVGAGIASAVASSSFLDASGRLSFGQLASLLADAALYVGADGSVTHLAAACGTPSVAIFGPTDPRRWGPLSRAGAGQRYERVSVEPQRVGRVVLLQGAQAGTCVPCGRAGCDDHRGSRSACLEAIDGDRVLAEARRVLAERRADDAGVVRANAGGVARANASGLSQARRAS